MDDFSGKKYTLVSSENFDEYLEYLGVGYFPRKVAANFKPTQRLTLNDDGTYTFDIISPVIKSSITFTSGVEFDEKKPDGTTVKATVTIEGNKMVHIQVEANGKTSTHVREFFADKVIVTTTAVGLDKIVTRTFKRED